jgi:aminodeoxychorismate lyase
MHFFYLNNELHSNTQTPVFSINNRSFKYGDGFFESIRIVNGKVIFWEKHSSRLVASMHTLRMDFPQSNMDVLPIQLNTLCERNNIKAGGRARITFYRRGEGMYSPENNKVDYIIEAYPMEPDFFELNSKGLVVDVYSDFKKPLNKLSNIKTNNCLTYVLASAHRNEKQLDDCLLLNDRGNIAEATSSNIFMAVGEALYTPALSEACLDGVMRRVILDIAVKNRIKLIETEVTPNHLLGADELFITSSVRGIHWVSAYKSKRYYNRVAKKLVNLLNEEVQVNLTGDTPEN